MRAAFQQHLDAVAPHLEGHHLEALEKVLHSWSVNDDEFALRACDVALSIVLLPVPLRQRQSMLHRFICDMGTRSHDA